MRYILILILFIASTNTFSIGAGSGHGKITQLWTDSGGNAAFIRFSNPIVPVGCEGGELYVVDLDNTHGSSRFYSTLLAAYISQKEVQFWIDGCSNYRIWGKNRGHIYDIYL